MIEITEKQCAKINQLNRTHWNYSLLKKDGDAVIYVTREGDEIRIEK